MKNNNNTCHIELLKLLVGGFSLATLGMPALAFTFGNIDVRSHLGENFDALVNFTLSPGEEVDESCFKLAPAQAGDDLAGLPSAVLSVNPVDRGGALQIRSRQRVNDPALKIALQTNCPGIGQLQREYVVLLDPPALLVIPQAEGSPAGRAAELSKQAVPSNSPSPREGSEWSVRRGDSFAAIAQGAHPRNAKAREALVQAMIAANLQLGGYGPDDLLPAGDTLLIPRLSRTKPVEIAKPLAQPAPAAAARPRGKPAQASTRNKTTKTSPGESRKVFQLKLSTADVDLSRSEKMTEEERAQLREKQLLLDADDQVANMLALKNSVKQLEARLAGLQAQIAVAPVKVAPPVTGNTPSPTEAPARGAVTAKTSDARPAPQTTVIEWLAANWYWWLAPVLAMLLLLLLLKRQRSSESPNTADYPLHEKTRQGEDSRQATPVDGLVDLDFNVGDPQATAPIPPAETHTDPRISSRDDIANQFPELQASGNTDPETLIAVAWKYFEEHGVRGRAVELVEFGLNKYPESEELWMTQFEFLRRDMRRSAYEQLAKHYLERFPKGAAWAKIQAGGRILEPDNVLYAGVNEVSGLPLDLDLDITGGGNGKAAMGSVPEQTITWPEVPVNDPNTPLDFTPSDPDQTDIHTKRPMKR